jgi:hypothetical protein
MAPHPALLAYRALRESWGSGWMLKKAEPAKIGAKLLISLQKREDISKEYLSFSWFKLLHSIMYLCRII